MDAHAAAAQTADAVGGIGSHFMLDGTTYQRAAELGFSGLDFYFSGRGGVLGDVHADVVAAAFAFFEPTNVATQWDLARDVMPREQAAAEFAGCCHRWADATVPDDLDAARLATLAGKVVAGARPAGVPLFAAWRQLSQPAEPKAAAVRAMNDLRELRNGLHAAAVLAAGLAPQEAVAHRTPHMAALFGWTEPVDLTGIPERWSAAEEGTTRAIAHAYEALEGAELGEFVELANQLHTSV